LVVESSHSATYIVPFFDGEPINYAIRRVDIGGKLLTKHLLNLITKRYI
jgi:actin-related protein 6